VYGRTEANQHASHMQVSLLNTLAVLT
jgi:hypothetical protein